MRLTFFPANTSSRKVIFVVSKRVASSAVLRNKIRRRAKAALGRHTKKVPHGVYVFSLYQRAAHTSFKEIAREIEWLLHKVLEQYNIRE